MIHSRDRHNSRHYTITFDTVTNNREDLISKIGYQDIQPQESYPNSLIPRRYGFDIDRKIGRQLAEYQLVYITGGTGSFMDKSGTKAIIPGTMILLRPNYWHAYAPHKDIGWIEYYIGFNGPGFRETIDKYFGDMKGPVKLGLSATMVDLFEQALYYAERQNEYTKPLLQSLLMHILALMYYNLESRNGDSDKVVEAMNYVKQYLTNHISEDINMEELAQSMGMSYSWFRRMFKKNTGLAPAQYLSQLRIQSAMYYLRNTSNPIKNVAFDCGFKTVEYFCTVFQSSVSMSPKQYREANKNEF